MQANVIPTNRDHIEIIGFSSFCFGRPEYSRHYYFSNIMPRMKPTMALTVLLAILFAVPVFSQSSADKGAVVGTGTFTAFVENMDRSLGVFS
jgi:hypothetical protein